nr:hypothetical protein [Bacteroides acidifaciens]
MNEKLTADALAKMKLGGRSKTFRCDTAAELESARQNAYYIKRNCPRPDGATYNISYSVKAMIVTVSLTK